METTEKIETINQLLQDHFGIETESTNPIYRVVWSDDQFELKKSKYTPGGIELLLPEVMKFPKYWFKARYVLEKLVIVPEVNQDELTEKKSYEPLWVFQGKNDEPVPPTFWACKFVIDTVNAAMGKKGLVKYVDEEVKNPEETRAKRIKEMEEALFGDESGLLGTTITGESIIVPQNTKELK